MIRFLVVLLVFSSGAHALNDSSHAVGRYWGEREQKKQEVKRLDKRSQVVETISSKAIMAEITKSIDEIKAKAIINPTVENVAAFRRVQNKASNMSTKFSNAWQQVSLQYPELDYASSHSTNSQALQIASYERNKKIKSALKEAAKTHALIFFYQSNNRAAALQADILTRFAAKHGFELLGATLDGKYLPQITNNMDGVAQYNNMHVKQNPAIFLLNPATGKSQVISYALLSENELEEHVASIFIGNGE